jgi:hypothetical protein
MNINFGIFHETAKVVNSLFGATRPIAEFGAINYQLEFEGCRIFLGFSWKALYRWRYPCTAIPRLCIQAHFRLQFCQPILGTRGL